MRAREVGNLVGGEQDLETFEHECVVAALRTQFSEDFDVEKMRRRVLAHIDAIPASLKTTPGDVAAAAQKVVDGGGSSARKAEPSGRRQGPTAAAPSKESPLLKRFNKHFKDLLAQKIKLEATRGDRLFQNQSIQRSYHGPEDAVKEDEVAVTVARKGADASLDTEGPTARAGSSNEWHLPGTGKAGRQPTSERAAEGEAKSKIVQAFQT